jgi:hypothetical protein
VLRAVDQDLGVVAAIRRHPLRRPDGARWRDPLWWSWAVNSFCRLSRNPAELEFTRSSRLLVLGSKNAFDLHNR